MLGPLGLGSKSRNKQCVLKRTDCFEKVLCLFDSITARREVISAPKQSRCLRLTAVGHIHWIAAGRALRSFMNDTDDSITLSLD